MIGLNLGLSIGPEAIKADPIVLGAALRLAVNWPDKERSRRTSAGVSRHVWGARGEEILALAQELRQSGNGGI